MFPSDACAVNPASLISAVGRRAGISAGSPPCFILSRVKAPVGSPPNRRSPQSNRPPPVYGRARQTMAGHLLMLGSHRAQALHHCGRINAPHDLARGYSGSEKRRSRSWSPTA